MDIRGNIKAFRHKTMTVRETERLAKVEAKQDNMADNIDEIKQDIKELKSMMQNISNNYITKKAVQWIIGLLVSIFTAGIYLWDVLLKSHK